MSTTTKKTFARVSLIVIALSGAGASAMGSKKPTKPFHPGNHPVPVVAAPAPAPVVSPQSNGSASASTASDYVFYNGSSSRELPALPKCVVEVKDTIRVKGTLDGKGCLYTWRGAGYPENCRAPEEIDESQPPMFVLEEGATLKNLQMECALDGIHTTRNNLIDNIVNRDVEEDAITIGENITIQNSQFWYCNDKCLQMNRANNVIIRNNRFFHSNKPVLANYGYNILVMDNYMENIKRGIRSTTTKSFVKAYRNTVNGAECYVRAEKGGLLEDWGEATLINVESAHCEAEGGRVVDK